MSRPRIAIPVPTSTDLEYNRKSWGAYASAVERSGGEPVEVPLNATATATVDLIAACSGIVLPGSGADVDPHMYGQEPILECAPADPAREAIDMQLLENAEATGKPVLGICFGTQMLNVWRGGTLVQDLTCIPVNHKAGRAVAVAHVAVVAPESLIGQLVDSAEAPEHDGFLRLPINSSHHQAIEVPGDGLRITARSTDDGVIEAVEGDTDRFEVGVQWHPERTFDESATSRALFAKLVSEAAAWISRSA